MNMQQLISIFSSSCVAGCPEQKARQDRERCTNPGADIARMCFSVRNGGNTPKNVTTEALSLLAVLSPCSSANLREAQRGVRSCFGWRNKSGKKKREKTPRGKVFVWSYGTRGGAARHERPLTGPVLGERRERSV